MTNIGHFAHFGREQKFELSNCKFGGVNMSFLAIMLSMFLSGLFILCGCDMVNNVCSGIDVPGVAGNPILVLIGMQ
jgi:hypothetical protein